MMSASLRRCHCFFTHTYTHTHTCSPDTLTEFNPHPKRTPPHIFTPPTYTGAPTHAPSEVPSAPVQLGLLDPSPCTLLGRPVANAPELLGGAPPPCALILSSAPFPPPPPPPPPPPLAAGVRQGSSTVRLLWGGWRGCSTCCGGGGGGFMCSGAQPAVNTCVHTSGQGALQNCNIVVWS